MPCAEHKSMMEFILIFTYYLILDNKYIDLGVKKMVIAFQIDTNLKHRF